ncbi:hypothetical protein FOA43_003788 [Brettanomyces nanus]|uniref:Mitochondrial 15S rRNA processing factor CCM1 n=1 Tax=Eeniella nana TaxID=13502 RepID=A0A875S9W2_EENNA|nr:uncharacterized protein FOA43_003788 [Brettanomyces nanus]QPG76399.1 hypothetical protein FOA43_003788 [Brettanomyces nanus]
MALTFTTKTRSRNQEWSRVRAHTQRVESDITSQLRSLQEFTRQVKQAVEKKRDEEKAKEIIKDLKVDNDIDYDKNVQDDAESIFNALSEEKVCTKDSSKLSYTKAEEEENAELEEESDLDLLSLFPSVHSYTQLPVSITEQLDGDTLQYIASEETANWIPVISRLASNSNSLSNATSYDAHILLKSIPKEQRPLIIAQFHKMVAEAGLLDNRYIYNDLMASYNLVNVKESLPIIERLYKEMTDEKAIKPDAYTMGIMINLYSRRCNVDKTKEFLGKITDMGDHPTFAIYTSVLQMYVRMGEYRNAVDVFDTMKFLSLETFPTSRTYSSMILLDTLNNEIEHGMALYKEMIDRNIKVEPQALLSLSKGCTTRKGLTPQGWAYILEYYANDYPISYKLIEVMMNLAAKDSDLSLVRALYLSIFENNTKTNGGKITPTNATALKYLFNAYFSFDKDSRPVSVVDERVMAIRLRSLELMNFTFHDEAPPMLPLIHLPVDDNTLMMKESKAIFEYHVLKFPEMISEQVLEAYLFVLAVRGGSIREFEKAWNKYTYFKNEEDTDSNVTVEGPEPVVKNQPNEIGSTTPVEDLLETSPVTLPRDDRLYNACMHAARHFKDVIFAQKIWIERGRFRKTQSFQSLKPYVQDQQDFKFARAMLSCFVETGNVVDAYQLILSSQSRFVWTYYHLKSVLILCEKMGYVTFKTELMKVISKSNKFLRRQERHS